MAGIDHGTAFSETATHATAATATHAAATGKTYYITDISASSDKAGALLVVKQGTTTVWQVQLAATAAGNLAYSHSFVTPIRGETSALVSITVDGTSVCNSNIAGYEL